MHVKYQSYNQVIVIKFYNHVVNSCVLYSSSLLSYSFLYIKHFYADKYMEKLTSLCSDVSTSTSLELDTTYIAFRDKLFFKSNYEFVKQH